MNLHSLRPRLKWPVVLPLLAGLLACRGYEVTVNERPVYSPAPLFTDFSLPDRNLQACVDQHIKDLGIRNAGQLQSLRCTHAGIEDLSGLSRFARLQRLDLSDNKLTRIDELARLTQLHQLNLDNNQLRSAAPLLALIQLEQLSLAGNAALSCNDIQQLAGQQALSLTAPEQCQ